MALTMAQTNVIGLLNDVIRTGGSFDPANVYVGLYTALAVPVSPTVLMADLTEATYTGYARQAVTAWEAPYIDAAGYITLQGPSMEFRPSDAVTPNTIMGVFLASAVTAGTLLGLNPLNVPVPLANALSVLTVISKAGILRLANWGNFGISN